MLSGLGGCIAGAAVGGSSSGGSSSGGSLIASLSPTSIWKTSGTTGTSGTKVVTTGTVTATVTSGSGGYTYAWSRTSGDSRITANSPSAASTTFTATLNKPEDSASASFRCRLSDASGATLDLSCDVEIDLVYTGGSA